MYFEKDIVNIGTKLIKMKNIKLKNMDRLHVNTGIIGCFLKKVNENNDCSTCFVDRGQQLAQ